MPADACRCGHTGDGPHPCHRCGRRPGDRVLRGQETPYSIAGMQPKVSALETWACAECRAEYRREGGFVTEPETTR